MIWTNGEYLLSQQIIFFLILVCIKNSEVCMVILSENFIREVGYFLMGETVNK